MQNRVLSKILIWTSLLIFLMACLIPGSAATPSISIPTLSQGDLGTIIAQTANAALIQTSSALPSATSTPTRTRIPSKTPTYTPTFIYIIPTISSTPTTTPVPPPVGNIIVNGTVIPDERMTGRPWTCLVTGSTPPRNVAQAPGKDFYVTWTVMNTGTKDWWNNGIDFLYESGYRTEQRHLQDLPLTVPSGRSTNLKILLTAPKTAGTYNSIWALKVGRTVFCRMRIEFLVK